MSQTILIGGLEGHPGHEQGDCIARHTVIPHPYATSRPGYSCLVTGGHCVPGDFCAKRREDHQEFLEQESYYR